MRAPTPDFGTAVWLVEKTAVTFSQIATFCRMTQAEVQAVADGDLADGVTGHDPVLAGMLTEQEITRCIRVPIARLGRFQPRRREPSSGG
jgi:hypothetical protein